MTTFTRLHTRGYSRIIVFTLVAVLCAALTACDPLAPVPTLTPQVIIVTSPPTATPEFTATPTSTKTPIPTSTPDATPTATPFPCEQDKGQVLNISRFASTIAGENLRYRVYVPPCYFETGKRYPSAILLHASNKTETQWETIGVIDALDQGIRLGALPPMILVMPYTGAIGTYNQFPPAASYENVVLEELLPAIDRDFCTISNRDHRAIGGIGRGGFWAFSIGLRHPDIFSIIGGHSALFRTDNNTPPAFNPLELALNSAFLEDAKLRMYLDNGATDQASANQELFSNRLTSRGIPHTYIINPVGEHNDEYWSAHVSEYLAFYGETWSRTTSPLPSCLEPSP